MERKDLDTMTLEEVKDALQKSIDEFKKEVATINDLDELEKRMDEISDLMTEDKKYIDSVQYDLPESCNFQPDPAKAPECINASSVANKIIYFINKNEVSWQYTLGMYQLVRFWKSTPKTITYGAYDSTLRLLGQVKFKGESEWRDILVVNEYLTACHETYTKDLNWITYHSTLMTALDDQRVLLEKANNAVDENEAVMEDMQAEAMK